MKTFINTHMDDLTKGVAALCINALAVISSFQEQAEWGLRVASLIAAIGVSALTAWSIWRKNRSR